MSVSRFRRAARRLSEAHDAREPFAPLPDDLAPKTEEDAYAIQDAFLALRADREGAIIGYKIALTSAQMRRFVGLDRPQAGALLESRVRSSPARVRATDYLHLLVEFEIAVEMAQDLPAADAPFFRSRVADAVGAVMPALELVDDRHADYQKLPQHPYELVADNTWNAGVVLGAPQRAWQGLDLASARGEGRINGHPVGEGRGSDAMGHPFDAVAWVADHLASLGRGLLRGDVVITGSMITSKAVKAGDVVQFAVEGLGEVELRVE